MIDLIKSYILWKLPLFLCIWGIILCVFDILYYSCDVFVHLFHVLYHIFYGFYHLLHAIFSLGDILYSGANIVLHLLTLAYMFHDSINEVANISSESVNWNFTFH